MNGLLLVDKPVGISSFDVIRELRRITGFRKIGHAGTLDPLASGLMLMLFGPACKQAERFSKLDKSYVAQVVLGANSTTGDMEGQKTRVSDRVPTTDEILLVLGQLQGLITQVPSQYSAIKIGGTEAYKLARAGKTVEMPSRQVTVHSYDLLDYDYPNLRVGWSVSSGTYIRTLAEDMGGLLGVGAHLSGLRRTVVGEYGVESAVTLDGLSLDQVTKGLILQ
jgi:tRNA pseudouridine55 synthase